MQSRSPCFSALVLAALCLQRPAMADPAPPVPLQMAQAGSEFDFWNAIKDSKKAEDYQAYLDKYPDGIFADLAKLRMKKYPVAAAPAPAPAPAAVAPAAPDPQQADIAYWNSIKASKSAEAYRAYLEKYPNGEFVDVAKLRVEQLSAPAAAPAAIEPTPPVPAPPVPAPPQAEAPKPATMEPATWDPAPAQGMTFEAKDTTVYAKDGGQVRAAPSPQAPLVIKLKPDTDVHATGLSSDRRWWRVEVAGGQVGYMHHSVVSDRVEPEAAVPLPATTQPATSLPATTQPATSLPTTTQPATSLPTTTQPATSLPATTQPTSSTATDPSSEPLDSLETSAPPSSMESAAAPQAPDETVCPAPSEVAPDDRVAACARLAAQAGPEAKLTALGDLAAALAQARRYDEAVRAYKQVAALAPRDAKIYYDIGLVRLDQLRFPEARTAFDMAAQFDPKNPDIVFQRGISYAGLGDFETARLEVRSALLSKDDAAYYEKLGEIEIARGDLGSAKIAVERARKADASRGSMILAVVDYYVGDNAIAAAQVAANSNDPAAALWNALIRKATGDADGAAQALEAGRSAYGGTWPGPIFAALSGTLSLTQASALARAKDDKVELRQICALNFFAGEWAYLSGDKDGARAALQAAVSTRAFDTLAFAAAKARLANMGE
jgi:Flp pilus assembly protein TadD